MLRKPEDIPRCFVWDSTSSRWRKPTARDAAATFIDKLFEDLQTPGDLTQYDVLAKKRLELLLVEFRDN